MFKGNFEESSISLLVLDDTAKGFGSDENAFATFPGRVPRSRT